MKKLLVSLLFLFQIILLFGEERIISLSHFTTAILVELGQEDKMIARGWERGNNFSEEVQMKLRYIPKISDGVPTKENIYSYSPTLLIGWKSAFTTTNLGTKEQLEKNGISIFYFESASSNGNVETFYEDLRKLGNILNIQNKIEKKIKEIKEKIESVEKKKEETIIFLSNVEQIPSVIGGGGLLEYVIEKSGYINIFKDVKRNYFNSNWEKIVDIEIDNIVILASNEKEFIKKYRKILKNKYFIGKNAMKNKNIFYLNYIYTAPNLELGDLVIKLNKKDLKRAEEILERGNNGKQDKKL